MQFVIHLFYTISRIRTEIDHPCWVSKLYLQMNNIGVILGIIFPSKYDKEYNF